MTHISRASYPGFSEQSNGWRVPATQHSTYCGKHNISASSVDNENPTCEDCMDSKTWEEIDARNEDEVSGNPTES